jgi:origin recognition complex subunit 3
VHSDKAASDLGDNETPALWELPDTSILFRRYLDSGKMINVYDWYESFAVVLEDQRRQIGEMTTPSSRKSASPRKRKGRRMQEQEEEEEEEGMNDEELERWRMEVQARFIRALHELDFLGFIKHTGRKADHVIRTVFEAAD